MLEAPSSPWGVPHPRQYVDLGQFAQVEAAPVLRRTVRRELLVTRSTELVGENMGITSLCSENERTEEPKMTLVPGANISPRQDRVSDEIVFRIGG